MKHSASFASNQKTHYGKNNYNTYSKHTSEHIWKSTSTYPHNQFSCLEIKWTSSQISTLISHKKPLVENK